MSSSCQIITVLLTLAITKNVGASQIKPPAVGAYQQVNFNVIKVFSEEQNSQVVLPILKQSYYADTGIQLLCNASYPVQWIYRSTTGTPRASVITERVAPNQAVFLRDGTLDKFEAKVTFLFLEKGHEGNYSCESVNDPRVATFMNVKVGDFEENRNKVAKSVMNTPIERKKPSSKLRLTLSQKKSDRAICCSPNPSHFLKIRFMKCGSVSDCRLKQVYMDNNRNCTDYYCSQDRVRRTQDKKKGTCSIFEMGDDYGDEEGGAGNPEFRQGIFQCSNGEDSTIEYLIFTKLHDNTIVKDFSVLPSSTSQILRIETEETSGNAIFLTCNANSFYFSHGWKWAFQESGQSEYNFFDEGHGRASLRFPKKDVGGKTVYCFAPVWNGNEWGNTSIFLDEKWKNTKSDDYRDY